MASTTPSVRVFNLIPDNPCNCTIVDQETDEIWYTVSTQYFGGKHTVTKVMDGDDNVIASWRWREYRGDILTLGSVGPMNASTWLRKSWFPLTSSVSFCGKDSAKYTWKSDLPRFELELYSSKEDQNKPPENSGRPIAQFTKSVKGRQQPAALSLDSRGQEIRDLIVISFLMLEKDNRMKGREMP
ncbi:hypothetical protein BKA70DRAFT_1398494 [Coprinopsis sp. MPI-PUGE-AT-0042]|nr:hypothetical protein BKA70DRAFT_1398494 [Coprinopsis sp. MPI-PUGE-AT-0042]